MSAATVLDASVLIALMNPGDVHYADAVAMVRRGAIAGGLLAHPMTVAESAVGAAEHGRLEHVRRAFDGLGLVTAESDPEQPWRLAALRAEARVPLPDCCVLDLAIRSGGHLATFDTRLAGAARRHGVTLAAA